MDDRYSIVTSTMAYHTDVNIIQYRYSNNSISNISNSFAPKTQINKLWKNNKTTTGPSEN